MQLLTTLLIGFFIGLLARFFVPGRNVTGLLLTSLLGIAGSFAASYVGQVIGLYNYGEPAGLIASVLGAIGVLSLYRAIARKES